MLSILAVYKLTDSNGIFRVNKNAFLYILIATLIIQCGIYVFYYIYKESHLEAKKVYLKLEERDFFRNKLKKNY